MGKVITLLGIRYKVKGYKVCNAVRKGSGGKRCMEPGSMSTDGVLCWGYW